MGLESGIPVIYNPSTHTLTVKGREVRCRGDREDTGMAAHLSSVIVMLLLLMLSFLAVDGVIPACVDPNENPNNGDMLSFKFLWECDMYHSQHLVNPMLLMVLTKNPVISFLIPGVFEIAEVLGVARAGNYIIFAGSVNEALENIVDVVLIDWALQAALGIALGWLVLWFWKPPLMWRGWYTDRGHFWRWTAWFLALMVPQVVYGHRIDRADITSFPLGAIITITLQAFLFGFLVQHEPSREVTWRGWSERDRTHFWVGYLAIHYAFELVVIFDLLYSSIIQVWLLWFIWILALSGWAWIDGRGEELIRTMDFMGAYSRRIERKMEEEKDDDDDEEK